MNKKLYILGKLFNEVLEIHHWDEISFNANIKLPKNVIHPMYFHNTEIEKFIYIICVKFKRFNGE